MPPLRELSPHAPMPLLGSHEPPPRVRPVREELSPFARLVRGFSGEADRGEATMRSALGAQRSGVSLDPTSLLALQAGIYRYGETMDLAARLVDKASSGVKTVVQGQ